MAARDEVLEAYVFGSQALGRAQAHSDLDIAVFVDERALRRQDYGYAAQLTTHLMAALGSNEIKMAAARRGAAAAAGVRLSSPAGSRFTWGASSDRLPEN